MEPSLDRKFSRPTLAIKGAGGEPAPALSYFFVEATE